MAKKASTLPQPVVQAKSKPTHVELQDAYRNEARKIVASISTGSFEPGKTTCLMFYLDGDRLKYKEATSGLAYVGTGDRLQQNRSDAGIGKKETICAEEVLLAKFHEKFLFSWTFDTGLQVVKPACMKGCETLLSRRGIEDLVPR